MSGLLGLFRTLVTWLKQTKRTRQDVHLTQPADRHEWAGAFDNWFQNHRSRRIAW